jgi:hypothetical protein
VVLLGSVVDVVCEVDCALRGEDDGLYIHKKNGNFNYAQYHLPSSPDVTTAVSGNNPVTLSL